MNFPPLRRILDKDMSSRLEKAAEIGGLSVGDLLRIGARRVIEEIEKRGAVTDGVDMFDIAATSDEELRLSAEVIQFLRAISKDTSRPPAARMSALTLITKYVLRWPERDRGMAGPAGNAQQ